MIATQKNKIHRNDADANALNELVYHGFISRDEAERVLPTTAQLQTAYINCAQDLTTHAIEFVKAFKLELNAGIINSSPAGFLPKSAHNYLTMAGNLVVRSHDLFEDHGLLLKDLAAILEFRGGTENKVLFGGKSLCAPAFCFSDIFAYLPEEIQTRPTSTPVIQPVHQYYQGQPDVHMPEEIRNVRIAPHLPTQQL